MYEFILIFFIAILIIHGTKGCNNDEPCDGKNEHLYLLDEQCVEVYYMEYAEQKSKTCIQPCSPGKTTMNISIFDPDYLLQNITRLEIKNLAWSITLPESSQLEWISINDVTSSTEWGGCSRLIGAELCNINYTSIKLGSWLGNCKNLQNLELIDIDLYEIPPILDQAQHIQYLNLFNIKRAELIMQIPLFSEEKQHRYNNIKEIKLYIDYNTRTEIYSSIIWQLALLPELKMLVLLDINLCPSGTFSSVSFGKLETLKLVTYHGYSPLCFRQLRAAPLLQKVVILCNEDELQFAELFSAAAPNLHIDIFGCSKTTLFFTRPDFVALLNRPQKRTVTLNTTALRTLQIDCYGDALFWFTMALKENLLKVENTSFTCSDGQHPLHHINNCNRSMCERIFWRAPCVICVTEETDSFDFDCQDGKLAALPDNLLNLNYSSGLDTTENGSTVSGYQPHKLHRIYLSNNNISGLTATELAFLFEEPNRQIWLAGNPIDCTCNNRVFLNTLKDHVYQIMDFENITCKHGGKKLSKVNVTEICMQTDLGTKMSLELEETKKRENVLITIVVTVTVVAVIVTCLLAVGMNYRKQLRMFLFAHGWCLCCIREEELDADRHFDVFLSFCHADQDIVLNELLPTLDRDYSVCIHLRDWWPGEKIPKQIIASVEQSRRTIVFMSKSFLKSLWGILEFRTAYMSSLLEGRIRVIMIVVDDVLESENLPKEVRTYVRYNTYVQWDDPWLWEKLRYALPHRPAAAATSNVSPQLCIEYPLPIVSEPLPQLRGEQTAEEQQAEMDLQEVEVIPEERAIQQIDD